MIRLVERKDTKSIDDILETFASSMEAIAMALDGLKGILLLNKDWNLKEGQNEFIKQFDQTKNRILLCLMNMEASLAWLRSYCIDEKPPYNIGKKGLDAIAKWTKTAGIHLALYKRKTMNSTAPQLIDEEKRLRRNIDELNILLISINVANKSVKGPTYPLIQNPFKK